MAAAHVQHVVGHVSPGNVVGDHFGADGASGAGSLLDIQPGDERGGGYGVDRFGGLVDGDGGFDAGEVQGKVENGIGSGLDGDDLFLAGKSLCFYVNCVDAERNGVEIDLAVGAGNGLELEVGVSGAHGDLGAGDGKVLRVVNNTVDGREDRGAGRESRKGEQER